MARASRSSASIFLCMFAVFLWIGPLRGQQNAVAPPAQENVGQQALKVLLRQIAIDSSAFVEKTGKPLPSTGKWSIGKDTPPVCLHTTPCVRIFYQVPEDDVTCWWVVQLNDAGNEGTILEQNEASSRYLLRKLSPVQAKTLVTKKEIATYPAIARMAHAQGDVVLRTIVSATGAVENVAIVSGPEMLRASAVDAMKKWTFKPLMTGTQPLRFETEVTFEFRNLGPDPSMSKVFTNP